MTPEEKEILRNKQRFTPFRYSLRGSDHTLVDDMVLELKGHFAYPKGDAGENDQDLDEEES